MKKTISIPDREAAKLRVLAAKRGTSFKRLLEDGLADHFGFKKKKK